MQKHSIDAGRLRHRLVLERQSETSDGCGGFTTDWELVASIWASIDPVTQSQNSTADALNSNRQHTIAIRWRSDCKPEMRFKDGDREFAIMSTFDPDETKRYLICTCEEAR